MSTTNNVRASVIAFVYSISSFVVGSVMGMGVDLDNLSTDHLLFYSSLGALLIALGVFLAARQSPKYAYLWLALIASPIVLGFQKALLPSKADTAQTLTAAALPFLAGLLVAIYVRSKHKRESAQG